MVSMQFCIVGLTVLFFNEAFSNPVQRAGTVHPARRYDLQPLQAAVDSIDGRLENLSASVTATENELAVLRAKRCETGQVFLQPNSQASVPGSNGYPYRTHKIRVDFAKPFATIPWVSVGLSQLDVYNNANLRIVLGVEAVSTSGFNAYAYEWDNTHVVSATSSWVACNF